MSADYDAQGLALQALAPQRRLGGRSDAWVPIGYRLSGGAGDGTTIDGANTVFNQRVTFFAPASANIRALRLAWGRFNTGPSWERDADAGFATKSDSLVYNNVALPFYWSGRRTSALDAGRGVMLSDPLAVAIRAGDAFSIGSYGTWSGNLRMMDITAGYETNPPSAYYPATATSVAEGSVRGTSGADITLQAGGIGNTGGGLYPPLAVYALLDRFLPAILIAGDSIITGYKDNYDSRYLTGYAKRALGNALPWISLSKGGTYAQQVVARPDALAAVALPYGVTDFVNGWGRNDLMAQLVSGTYRTPAQLRADCATIEAPFTAAGVRTWRVTIPPSTNSSDGWASAAGQTIRDTTMEASRLAYNADLRANWRGYGLAGVIDVAGGVEDGANPGKWRGDGGVWTGDGTHPSSRGHQGLIDAGAMAPSRFLAAAGVR